MDCERDTDEDEVDVVLFECSKPILEFRLSRYRDLESSLDS